MYYTKDNKDLEQLEVYDEITNELIYSAKYYIYEKQIKYENNFLKQSVPITRDFHNAIAKFKVKKKHELFPPFKVWFTMSIEVERDGETKEHTLT